MSKIAAMTNPETAPRSSAPGRRLSLSGLLVAALGVAAYATQVAAGRLIMPWYLPVSATLGAVLIALALRRKRGVLRAIGLVAILLLAAAEWTFLFATRLPPYTGPVAIGEPFPTFKTWQAGGTAFTDRDLRGPQTTVLVFFRGRW